MKTEVYDIFISYRRESGADTAKHLRDVLTAKGYRVFFDTDSLRSGSFNRELLKIIRTCKDFVIILSDNSLDRCVNEDDWVRQELACALNAGKNIIPVMYNRFQFPDELPADINDLRSKTGITMNIEYFDAMVSKLLSLLHSKPHRKTARRLLIAIAGLLCVAAVVTAVITIRSSGKTSIKENTDTVSGDLLSIMVRTGMTAYNSGDYSTAAENLIPAADQRVSRDGSC